MRTPITAFMVFAAVAAVTHAPADVDAQPATAQPARRAEVGALVVNQAIVDSVLRAWPAKPRAVAYEMVRKYGLPAEATSSKLVWQNNGVWKRTVVRRQEIAHDFPKPHTDVIEQVINYRVPADIVDELADFDGSILVDRTAGELSARCGSEEMNLLALNLARDVMSGKKSAEDARKSYADHVIAFMSGPKPEYMTRLHLRPSPESAGDPDVTIIAGAPRRMVSPEIQPVAGGRAADDASVLAALIESNGHEVEEAMLVLESSRNSEIRNFAETLQSDHGQIWRQAVELGPDIGIVPVESELVVSMKQDGDARLAQLAQLHGDRFDAAFIAHAIAEHQKLLETIDSRLLPKATNPELQRQLRNARKDVASHLEQAKRIQSKYQLGTPGAQQMPQSGTPMPQSRPQPR